MSNVRKRMDIKECLFGPSRRCPKIVWDAVLTSNRMEGSSALSSDDDDSLNDGMTIPDGLVVESRWASSVDDNKNNKKAVAHVVPKQELRRIASQGIDSPLRAVAWRLLLEYLPVETDVWKESLLKKRQEYRSLVADLFVKQSQLHDGNDLRGHHGKRQAQLKKEFEMNRKSPPPPISTSTTAEELAEQQQAEDEKVANEAEEERIQKLLAEDIPASLSPSSPNPESPEKQVFNPFASSPTQQQQQQETSAEDDNLLNVIPPSDDDDDDKQDVNDKTLTEVNGVAATEEEGGCDDAEVAALTHQVTNVALQEQDAALQRMPSYDDDQTIKSQESLVDMVPAHIREEWKKSGRETETLDSMTGGDNAMNTLLVNMNGGDTLNTSRTSDDSGDSKEDDSKWFQFFENASLLDEIRKDVVRTHPDLSFFLEPENNLGQRRYAALERILFVWAKLNKGVRYVQGMNEIVGTIYYVLANDDHEVWACEAEADTYYLFNTLVSEMRDVFVPDMDEHDTGIQGRISNMTALLSLHDPEVRCHLVDIGIDPAFYAIRWLTTLLSREFLLPDTIRLWDSMFASTHKENFLRYVCVTMVMIIRDKVLKGDFSTCLRLLQAYPTTNIDSLLEASRALWIYESQVTLACHKGGISLHQALCTITPPPSIVMAYGLPGGVARVRRRKEQEAASSRPSRSFLSRANEVLGQIGQEVAQVRSRSRSRGPARGGRR